MSSSSVTGEKARLQDIAERYKERGYKVTVSPRSNRLPRFLSKFRPDMVAEGPNESVVIEVKSSTKQRGTDYWRELSQVVRKHPRWRLELVVNEPSRLQARETIDEELVRERLAEGQHLAQQGMAVASLLITWSAAEAAMRLAGKEHEIDLLDPRPARVISQLYTDGLLDQKEYDFLIECMRIRNTVAHGFYQGRIRASVLRRLQQITLRLLA